jgi:hypothetical protein
VKTIGAWVLYECKSLKSITFEGTINQWKAIEIDELSCALENVLHKK